MEKVRLHYAELHALYSSPNIIRNLKSRRLRWAGHVARMEKSRNAYSVLLEKSEGGRDVDGRIILKWIRRKPVFMLGSGRTLFNGGPVGC